MDTAQTIWRHVQPQHPIRRVNPSGRVVWIARWTDCNGKRRYGFRHVDIPEIRIPGTYSERGPCDDRGTRCCAYHAIQACYQLDAKYPEPPSEKSPGKSRIRSRAAWSPVAFSPSFIPSEGAEWIYVLQASDGGPVKIGYSASPSARLRSLQTGAGRALQLVALMPGSLDIERRLHAELADLRLHGEWFQDAAVIRIAAMFAAGIEHG